LDTAKGLVASTQIQAQILGLGLISKHLWANPECSQQVKDAVLGALLDKNAQVGEQACWTLRSLVTADPSTQDKSVEQLILAMTALEYTKGYEEALVDVGRDDKRVFPFLLDRLKAEKGSLSKLCLALGDLGDKRAIPAVLKYLNKDVPLDVRQSATEALAKLQASEAIPRLVELARDGEPGNADWSISRSGYYHALASFPQVTDRNAQTLMLETLRKLKPPYSGFYDRSIQFDAITAAGNWKLKEALPELNRIISESTDFTLNSDKLPAENAQRLAKEAIKKLSAE
jgi:HEAT repeat protein